MLRWLIAATAIVGLLLWASPGRPHDPFTEWRTHGGGSCCNRGDCVAVPHRFAADGLWLKIGDTWWKADDAEARRQTPLDDKAYACIAPGAVKPRCWAPPWSGA